jgi:hypothetical protein
MESTVERGELSRLNMAGVFPWKSQDDRFSGGRSCFATN